MAAMIDERLERLSELMERMMRAMSRVARPGCDHTELTPQQGMLLRELELSGPLSIGEVRRRYDGAQSSVSEMVARLARLGFVHKRPALDDRRAVMVAISARGRAVLTHWRGVMQAKHRAVFEALSDDEQERFIAAVQSVVDLAEKASVRDPEVETR